MLIYFYVFIRWKNEHLIIFCAFFPFDHLKFFEKKKVFSLCSPFEKWNQNSFFCCVRKWYTKMNTKNTFKSPKNWFYSCQSIWSGIRNQFLTNFYLANWHTFLKALLKRAKKNKEKQPWKKLSKYKRTKKGTICDKYNVTIVSFALLYKHKYISYLI